MADCASSDDTLMQAVAQGDAAAFGLLMQRHRPWILRLLRAFVLDDAQAEDLAQDVFARLYERRAEYSFQGKFTAWLKRVAVNLAKDFLRTTRRAPGISFDTLKPLADANADCDPAKALQSRVMQDEIRRAIQSLPNDNRLAVIMHYFGDMSLEDIAWAMKCPVGTVKSRLFHGRRRVRELLTRQSERQNDDEGEKRR